MYGSFLLHIVECAAKEVVNNKLLLNAFIKQFRIFTVGPCHTETNFNPQKKILGPVV
jgi:hypothetical protein